MSVFINLSNHPAEKWDLKQMEAALEYGELVEIAFPPINPHFTDEELDQLVAAYYEKVTAYEDPVVMLQGEFVFTFRLTTLLKRAGIKVVAGCSERRAIEFVDEDGNHVRRSVFEFVKFRDY